MSVLMGVGIVPPKGSRQEAPSRSEPREVGRDESCDVVVLGAGVVGVASAYALARRGLRVAIVDRAAGPGQGCSFANGAQLSYVYTDALASPALLSKMPALALGLDPVFRIRLSPDPEMLRWTLKFLAQCTTSRFLEATGAGLKLGLESRLALHELLERHPLSFGHAVTGKLHLHYSEEAVRAAAATAEFKRSLGAVQHVLWPKEARALEPALEGAEGLAGAIYSPEEEVGDPFLFVQALTEVLEREYGAVTRFGFEAAKVTEQGDEVVVTASDGRSIRGGHLVVALGAQASPFLKRLGIRSDVMPMKGYSFSAPPGAAVPAISITDSMRKVVFCPLAGQVRIAGLAELGRRDCKVDEARLRLLVEAASASLPGAARYEEATGGWAGLRPMSPTSLPNTSRARERIFLNIGHGMLGWTYAMGSAERLATLLTETLARSEVQ